MKRFINLLEGVDWGTYYTFQFYSERFSALDNLMVVGGWLGTYVATAILLILAILVSPPALRARMAFALALAFSLGSGLVEGVARVAHRVRPPDAQKMVAGTTQDTHRALPADPLSVLAPNELSRSFPSRAVFLGTFGLLILALGIERRCRRALWRLTVYVAASAGIVLLCVSQLWFGLHFVTDLLAGLTGGIALALTARWLATPPPGNALTPMSA